MKFGIRKKLLLLIVLLSLALIAASVLISTKLYSDSLKEETKKLCAETADSLIASIGEEHIDFVTEYAGKVKDVYEANREELELASTTEFESFEKREEYYSRFTEGIFPPKHGLGLSYEMLMFVSEYQLLLDNMDILSYAGGLDTASVFYYDREHGNVIYMIDRMPEGSTRYNFPISVKKPWNDQLKDALDRCVPAVYDDGTEYVALKPIPGTDDGVFIYFAKNDTNIPRSVSLFSLYTLGIMLGATIVIGLVVLLFADKLIVKNIRKLSAAADRFTSQIGGGSPEKSSAEITSLDEIGDLSGKFDLMQDSILGYITSLAEKTSREEKINAELELAARIQAESLPAVNLKAGAAELSSFLKPAKEVGGDLYDYFMLDEDRIFFCLADVSGKGIPASLFMMRAKELIKAGVMTGRPLDEFAFRLNNELCSGNAESVFITAFFGILDIRSGRLSYLRAGHEQPLLRREGSVTPIGEESNFVLGVFEDADFSSDETTLRAGDALLMFTDGLNEGINERNEEFGYERIAQTFNTAKGSVTAALYDALCGFCGEAEQFDDVTMLVLTIDRSKRIEIRDPSYADIPKTTDAVLNELSGLDPESLSEVGIIIDEIMNNQISYAFEGVPQPRLSVDLAVHGDEAELTFEDNGAAFDPLSDVTGDQIELSEGGFGIQLVRSLSDSQRYERVGGLNRLTVLKRCVRRPESDRE